MAIQDLSNLTVMIVDPNPGMRGQIHNMLVQAGISKVEFAPNAALATGAKSCLFHLKGAANMAPLLIEVDLDGQVDVTHVGGTAQTARDLGLALPAVAPNANGGLPILSSSGTTLAYTINTLTTYTGNTPQTGDSFARLGVAGAGLTALGDARIANLDALVSSRMATYTQPTGFLAATFPLLVASTTNITAGTITTTINLTNAPTSGDFTSTMKTSLNAATPSVTVSDKTGFSLSSSGLALVTSWTVAITGNITGNLSGSVGSVTAGVTVTTNNDKTGYSLTQSFPPNFAALGISAGGHITNVDTLTTYTGDTPQTGDTFSLANGASGFVATKTDTAAIKTKTDSMTFTISGQIRADVRYVTGLQVIGVGTSGNPWRPA